jgi:heme oxygenase
VPCRPLSVRVTAHGSTAQGAETAQDEKKRMRPGERKGFVEEMRIVAMKLHTKDQAPKEGEQAAAPKPFPKWQPTREGYLKFLAESKTLFETLEDIVEAAPHPDYQRFQDTGIERSAALAKDIQWFQDTYGLEPPPITEDGPGSEYSRLVQRLAEEDPPAFLCHFYNIYFAHSAGGRMIGKKVSETVLDGAQLEFYKYRGELKELLEGVRDNLNEVAETWTDQQKEHCLQETTESFKYSGAILRSIAA